MSVFEILKQQKKELDHQQQHAQYSPAEIRIQLQLDDKGASLQLVDKDGSSITPDHRSLTGTFRTLVKSINDISERNAFLIDWDNPDNRIYLNDYPHLIESVLGSGRLVDAALKPIQLLGLEAKDQNGAAATALATLKAVITPHTTSGTVANKGLSDRFDARLIIQVVFSVPGAAAPGTEKTTYDNFSFIAENYALIELPETRKIIKTAPIGSSFASIQMFNAEQIAARDLGQYLSLLFTYIEGIELECHPYTLQRETEALKPRPAIVFEKVDDDQHLVISIRQNLQNAPVGFLDDYALSYVATVNDMEQTVLLSPLEQLDMTSYINRVATCLKKHAPKGKKKAAEVLDMDGNRFHLNESLVTAFIYTELPNLILDYDLIGSEKLKGFKIKVEIPKLSLNLDHGIDFLEGDATLDFEGQKVSILDAILQYNKQRYIRLTDGTHALVNEQYMNRLKRLIKKNKNKKGGVAVSFFDLPAIEQLIEENQRTAHFARAREVYQGFNTIAENGPSLPNIQAVLRPYQLQGFQWISYLQQHKLGGCLADDMGLGKTVQTIAVLAAAYSGIAADQPASPARKVAKKAKTTKKAAGNSEAQLPPPSIIIMPKSLLFNWQNELKKFAPGLMVYQWHGPNQDIQAAMRHQIILTTYSTFRNDINIWKEQTFLYGILDESQAIKNMNSLTHKAVLLLKASYRLALSGTPIENNLGELYALFRYLNPALLGTADQFQQDYLGPIQKNNDRDAMTELRRKIYPFILRRLKKDVLTDLPDKQEQTVYVEMNSAQAKYYHQRRQFYKEAIDEQVATKGIKQSQLFIFQALNELRQIASTPEAKTDGRIVSSKLEALMEQLEEAIANDHKVLVFVNYLSAIESIAEALDGLNIGFLTMTGSTRDRQSLVDRFQNDPEIRAFIMTLKTGGTGLNLTAADMVFIFDPWWNKAAENQAIDRAHRMGQTSKVQSYKLISIGTIEEKILQLQELKSNLVDELISADSGSIKSISEDDIQFMLS